MPLILEIFFVESFVIRTLCELNANKYTGNINDNVAQQRLMFLMHDIAHLKLNGIKFTCIMEVNKLFLVARLIVRSCFTTSLSSGHFLRIKLIDYLIAACFCFRSRASDVM